MVGHTPGPWTVARFNPETAYCWVETVARGTDIPTQGYDIAMVSTYATEPGPNARLIAAAPDLLKHLRLAAIELAGWIECEEVPQHIAEEMSARLVAATAVLAAIDAARGGA